MNALWVALIIGFSTSAQAQLFTVNCQPLTQYRGDPIVFPGVVSPHVHAVIGSTAFNYTETNAEAIAGHATTCDKILDHSSYWQPQLYHHNANGTFSIVEFQGSAVYYINRACNYRAGRTSCPSSHYATAPPAGLRMVAGNPYLRTFNASSYAQQAISHQCLGNTASPQYNSLPPEPCIRLRSQVFFPSCWDGVHLDSADHSSHMAYPAIGDYNFGVCPSSHPIGIYSVFFEWFYNTAPFPDYQNLVYAMGDPTGYGLHGDFLQGWTHQKRLQNAMSTCTGPNGVNDPKCSLNLGGPNGAGVASAHKPQIPAPSENIGLHGPIHALPGNNPITGSFVRRGLKKTFVA